MFKCTHHSCITHDFNPTKTSRKPRYDIYNCIFIGSEWAFHFWPRKSFKKWWFKFIDVAILKCYFFLNSINIFTITEKCFVRWKLKMHSSIVYWSCYDFTRFFYVTVSFNSTVQSVGVDFLWNLACVYETKIGNFATMWYDVCF